MKTSEKMKMKEVKKNNRWESEKKNERGTFNVEIQEIITHTTYE